MNSNLEELYKNWSCLWGELQKVNKEIEDYIHQLTSQVWDALINVFPDTEVLCKPMSSNDPYRKNLSMVKDGFELVWNPPGRNCGASFVIYTPGGFMGIVKEFNISDSPEVIIRYTLEGLKNDL